MRKSGIARHYNLIPKENSKTQIKKREEAKKNYRHFICCKKCNERKTTLYKINEEYYCTNCRDKFKENQQG